MPHPAQITREALITQAAAMIEAEGGVERLTLAALAQSLGIKAPSLYHHVRSKTELLKAVNERTTDRLFAALDAALTTAPTDAPARIQAVAAAYRAFAHANPVTYTLAFTTIDPAARPDPTEQERAALPLQALMAAISGEANSLTALRGALALMHGFVMLELNAQLRRGGDLEAAYQQSIEAYLRGWTTP